MESASLGSSELLVPGGVQVYLKSTSAECELIGSYLLGLGRKCRIQKASVLSCLLLLTLFSHSVVTDSLWPHGLEPSRLLCYGILQQEYWSGLSFPSPGDLPGQGIEPVSPELAGSFFIAVPPGKLILFVVLANYDCREILEPQDPLQAIFKPPSNRSRVGR